MSYNPIMGPMLVLFRGRVVHLESSCYWDFTGEDFGDEVVESSHFTAKVVQGLPLEFGNLSCPTIFALELAAGLWNRELLPDGIDGDFRSQRHYRRFLRRNVSMAILWSECWDPEPWETHLSKQAYPVR